MTDRLSELRKSLIDMTPDELREKVRQIRIDRRLIKEKPAAKVAKRVRGAKAKTELMKLLESMSPEMREKVLGELDAGSQKEHTTESDQG